MKYVVLEPLGIEVFDGEYVRHCNIKRIDSDVEINQDELWFRFPKSISPPEDKDCDSYLLAVFMDAMQEGRDIIVKGSVSKGLLGNLIEYQAAWNKWLPNTYSIIDISVESTRDNEVQVSGAICAFSGGIDSTFSVWRHSQSKNSFRSLKINFCSLVHGFDIPLSNADAFANTTKRAITTLEDIGIKLVPIHTNYREVTRANWEHAHATALVATLGNFKRVAGTCVVGSSFPYNHIHIPWGSTPILDHLLSSDSFTAFHDGASHTRTEKVKEISEWTKGVENLRVCWEGDLKDRNCGKCEKCVRTMLNFLATGNPIPNCFPELSDTAINFNVIDLKNERARSGWEQILEYAKKNDVSGAWVKQVDRTIKRRPIIDIVLPKGSYRRSIVSSITRKISHR